MGERRMGKLDGGGLAIAIPKLKELTCASLASACAAPCSAAAWSSCSMSSMAGAWPTCCREATLRSCCRSRADDGPCEKSAHEHKSTGHYDTTAVTSTLVAISIITCKAGTQGPSGIGSLISRGGWYSKGGDCLEAYCVCAEARPSMQPPCKPHRTKLRSHSLLCVRAKQKRQTKPTNHAPGSSAGFQMRLRCLPRPRARTELDSLLRLCTRPKLVSSV